MTKAPNKIRVSRNYEDVLRQLGVRPKVLDAYGPRILMYTAFLGGLGAMVVWPIDEGLRRAGGILAATAFLLGFQQFYAVRRERALEKIRELRIVANDMLVNFEDSRELLPHFWPEDEPEKTITKDIYVHQEIANLEYALEQYKYGFLTSRETMRVAVVFGSRCGSEQFKNLATRYASGFGYYTSTQRAVAMLADNYEEWSPAAREFGLTTEVSDEEQPSDEESTSSDNDDGRSG